MLNLKTNRKQNHFRMLICWRWMNTQSNQELQSNRKQNHFRMINCWRWVLNQSERERQCLNKGTRHFRKRFIFSHQKLCLFWHGAETRVTKVRRFNLNIYVFPQKVHIFNEESLWTITSLITSHIYRPLTFISHFLHKSNTQTLWNHSSSSSHSLRLLHLLHLCNILKI